MGVRINALVRSGDAYVDCDNIISTLEADLSKTNDPSIQWYIRESIKVWEANKKDILNQ